ncbi:MAG: hypothetical protein F6J97_23510 [Leptolyngbya sp. SIO4C1]|nr:hypothetical protein [Leptolyngbya sp. SIO4C1]
MTTLADIAREQGVTPQAVGKWRDLAVDKYGELTFEKIGKRKEYDADAIKKILEFASQPQSAPEQSTPVPAEVQIYDGNHQVTLPTPQLNNGFALDALRSETDVLSYDDPLTLAQSVLAQNQQIVGAMDAHRQQQVQKLAATNQALQTIQLSNQQLRDAAIEYKIDSRVQGAQLNQATQQLGAAVAEQQRLGKPATVSALSSES